MQTNNAGTVSKLSSQRNAGNKMEHYSEVTIINVALKTHCRVKRRTGSKCYTSNRHRPLLKIMTSNESTTSF